MFSTLTVTEPELHPMDANRNAFSTYRFESDLQQRPQTRPVFNPVDGRDPLAIGHRGGIPLPVAEAVGRGMHPGCE